MTRGPTSTSATAHRRIGRSFPPRSRPLRFEQTADLAAPREAVWRLLAQTDHLNREVGLPPVEFAFAPRAGGGSDVTARVRVAGLTLRYREHPFEWARPSFYHVSRTFFGG